MSLSNFRIQIKKKKIQHQHGSLSLYTFPYIEVTVLGCGGGFVTGKMSGYTSDSLRKVALHRSIVSLATFALSLCLLAVLAMSTDFLRLISNEFNSICSMSTSVPFTGVVNSFPLWSWMFDAAAFMSCSLFDAAAFMSCSLFGPAAFGPC